MNDRVGLRAEVDQRAINLVADRIFNRLQDVVTKRPGTDPMPLLEAMLKALTARWAPLPIRVLRLAVVARMDASDAALIISQVDLSNANLLRETVAAKDGIR